MIQNPTARWVFFYFNGIDELTLPDGQKQVLNLNNHHIIPIGILGVSYKDYYS